MARGGPVRTWRGYGVLAAVPLLLATACGGGGGDGDGGRPAKQSPSTTGTPATGKGTPRATDGPVIDADPARLPTTRTTALALVRQVIADPGDLGPGIVARTPYESGPDAWPVLGADCVWQQRAPGNGVLATLTRSFEMPAARGKGPLRLAAIVTVHRTDDGARWEMAESIEESMRCPTQRLRQGETISGLGAGALAQGEANQTNSEDSLMESGEYRSDGLGGPYPYVWAQDQILRFTFAMTAKGAKGWAADEIDAIVFRTQSAMLIRLGEAIGKKG
ncbi:hypothetical protein ACFVWY_27515 [Streptomyces sp. NPDC058195]|uniref:hypothetical protein n=1 Tax=Streptomyces sp. NPDC058195 TaxID=3346375 RepID=UPI0036E34381